MISQHYGATKKRHRDSSIDPEGKGGQKSGPSRKTQERDAHGSAQAEEETTPVFVLEIEEASDGVVLVHGRTEAASQAVLLQIKGFAYSFYLEAKAIDDSEEPGMPAELVRHIREESGLASLTMEPVRKASLVGFWPHERDMVRVSFTGHSRGLGKVMAALDRVLGKGTYREYEAQVDMETRFSLESGVRCGAWLELPAACRASSVGPSAPHRLSQPHMLELTVHWDATQGALTCPSGQRVLLHSSSGEGLRWASLPNLRVLSLAVFRSPVALARPEDWDEDTDPVRMVGLVLTHESGGGVHARRRVLLCNAAGLGNGTSNGTSNGSNGGSPTVAELEKEGPWATRVFQSERELLQAFEALVIEEDPCVLTGFEVGEALRVLQGRAALLKLKNWGCFGRRAGDKVTVKRYQNYSAKWAKTKTRMSTTTNQESTEVRCAGRVVVDVMRVMQMQDALRLYSLGEIAMATLGRTFEMLTEAQLTELLGSSDRAHRRRAMQGALSVPDLALDVLHAKNVISEVVELSRVTGLGMGLITIRGQMARVLSVLLLHTHRANMVVPTNTEGLLDKHPLTCSAYVMDPMPQSDANPEGIGTVGMHRRPVAVLDYASLYPSVIIQHNLCFSTLLNRPAALTTAGLAEEEEGVVFTTPIGAKFVGPTVRRGVVPRLLTDLLESRRQASADIKKDDTPASVKRVLDARQKALKLCANSVYGFFGASVNSLFARELGDSTLALGREYLLRAISLVHQHYPFLKVIYGDTDSIFVEYPEEWSAERASQHARDELTPRINGELPPRVQMKHENTFQPLLLQHIRRYAALDASSPSEGPRRLFMRGIEAVQRNTMPLTVRLMTSTLRLLLSRTDTMEAKDHVRKAVADLMADTQDLHSLTMTRGLWRLGEYESRLPHVHLIERLETEDPRRHFRVGERVGYVLVQRDVGDQLYKKSEDPATALRRRLPLDLDEYLKQVRMPMVRLLSLVMPEAEAEELFRPTFRRGPAPALSADSPKAGIRGFFKRSNLQCAACRALLPATTGKHTGARLCKDCEGCPARALLPALEDVNTAQREVQSTASTCLGCQRGSHGMEILCENDTCPVYYRRGRAVRRVEEAAAKLRDIEEALHHVGISNASTGRGEGMA